MSRFTLAPLPHALPEVPGRCPYGPTAALNRPRGAARMDIVMVPTRMAAGILTVSILALATGPRASRRASAEGGQKMVVLTTTLGSIEVAVDSSRAPVTAANFLRYVEGGFYDGGLFHRTVRADNQPRDKVKIGVVQAGIDPARQKDEFPPIALERTKVTGLRHLDGAISMARAEPDTATSDFFICVGDQPELDFGGRRNPDGQGFAAFGRVVKGMDVVRRIQASPADGQTLTPPIKILAARVVN
jgi:peptidyl-prolyl cis-trans isomerase A (cyclophilin A)